MEEKLNKGREVIADKLNLPVDVVLDIPRIIVTGDREITIENHKGIIAFDKDEIKVNSRVGAIKIEGAGFEILYIGGSTITISGVFKRIIYEGNLL
ncbi:sporulation protein YqfC [Clostridium paraputrificum]|uniref:sporulation protein YqfC n=1 Tax=Clostridium TaxID=1485 RepID=UPI003D356710